MIILHKNIFNPFEVRKDKLAVLSKTCVQTNTEFLVKDDFVAFKIDWFYCVSTQKRLRKHGEFTKSWLGWKSDNTQYVPVAEAA